MRLAVTRLGTAVALLLLAAPFAAQAQPAGKVHRVGYLGTDAPAATPHVFEALRTALRDLGYVEGQNLQMEWRFSEGRPERLPELAGELVGLQVDVIVSGGELAIRAAKAATSTIPIVIAASGDPVGSGFVRSLARPGGNITGLSLLAPGLGAKRLELLRETVSRASRVAVLWNATNPVKAVELRETQVAAGRLGVALQSVELRSPGDLEAAFGAITRQPPDALITFSDGLTLLHRRRIAEFAAKARLPMMSELREFADAGGLMTYGASRPDLFRRAATYVDKILKGAKPADLPVEQPTKFELVINMKTAKALGLTIPPSLLLRADQIIE